MPSINDHHSAEQVKLLFMADSGSGKTGAICALANAGYNVRVLDYDNGLDICVSRMTDKGFIKGYLTEEGANRFHYYTLTDKLKSSITAKLGVIPDGAPESHIKAMKLLVHWRTATEDLGPLTEWTSNDIIVIDSLTFQGESALRFVMAREGGSMESKWAYYGAAMEYQEGLLARLYDVAIHCNVIVTSHISYFGEDEDEKGYPSGLGKKWPPRIARYFNSVLGIRVVGFGRNQKRSIITQSGPKIAYKNPAPHIIPPEILMRVDAEGHAIGGLADYFKLCLKQGDETNG